MRTLIDFPPPFSITPTRHHSSPTFNFLCSYLSTRGLALVWGDDQVGHDEEDAFTLRAEKESDKEAFKNVLTAS